MIISYKGKIADGLQDKIFLKTIKGKRGYRINKFEIMNTTPGEPPAVELTCKMFTVDQTGSITAVVDFTDGDLLAVATYSADHSIAAGVVSTPQRTVTIFDNDLFNQNIFITAKDVGGNAQDTNYYIELETVDLSDSQATMLTLKNLRRIASR